MSRHAAFPTFFILSILMSGCSTTSRIVAPTPALTEQRSTALGGASAVAHVFPVLGLVTLPVALAVDASVTAASQRAHGEERQKRFDDLLSKAEAGEPGAQVDLATMYRICYGSGTCEIDFDSALKWSLAAAEQDYADGMLSVGYTLASCPTRPSDRAADASSCTRDFSKALNWIRKSAEHGSAQGQWLMGILYSGGMEQETLWNIRADSSKSLNWFKQSAEQGEPLSQYALGLSYSRRRDNITAESWYRKAALKGHRLSMYYLGEILSQEKSRTPRYDEAYYWYKLSICNGSDYPDAESHPDVESALSWLSEVKLGPSDIDEQTKRVDNECAESISNGWKPKHQFR